METQMLMMDAIIVSLRQGSLVMQLAMSVPLSVGMDSEQAMRIVMIGLWLQALWDVMLDVQQELDLGIIVQEVPIQQLLNVH